MNRSFPTIFGIALILASHTNSQAMEFVEFETETGECSVTYKKDIQNQYLDETLRFAIPKSYTVKTSKIFKHSGISPPTGKNLLPLQSVLCLANDRDKVLVTSVDPSDQSCGWVLKDNLANVAISDIADAPCGDIVPLQVKDFCKIGKDATDLSAKTEKLIQGCYLKGVKDTSIDTKFVTDNTTSRKTEDAPNTTLAARKVPIFETSNSDQPFGSVDIFTVSKVFDAVPTDTGSIRVLIGNKTPNGWTELDNGHIWFSTLTTYFKPNGTKSVYQQKIVDDAPDEANQILATKPSANSFKVKDDFVKFPVLFDMRERDALTPRFQASQLEVAFIGKFCSGESGEMCSSDDNEYSQALANLRAADVVFLIDGSKSMSEYFGLVAENLTNFTENYLGNDAYRFGVAMYGDFKDPAKTSLGDPIDYKTILDLKPNRYGNFSSIKNAELLILDALKDKAEAAHAAVFEAARAFEWAEGKPHFLIHIADHGDRQRPSQKVFNALAQNNIFYVPIAVEGEAITNESQTFIDDAKIFAKNYTTENGNPMAVEAIKSYGNGRSTARESIAKALVEATGGWPDLGVSASDGDILPVLDAAAKEIFNIPETDDIQILAATGYIETAAIGSVESNWDYFVSLPKGDAGSLNAEMENVCLSLGDGEATKTITGMVFKMVRLLTGDKKSINELITIWREGAIPLQTETIIGSGIRDLLLATNIGGELLEPYKKEFCRSAALLKLMQKGFKLKVGEEGTDMIWEGYYFKPVDPVEFNWLYTDMSGMERFYIPLSYLPRPLD
jgi:hypothetical protein